MSDGDVTDWFTACRDDWCQNLGPRDKVAEVLSRWLGSRGNEKSASNDVTSFASPYAAALEANGMSRQTAGLK